MLTHNFKGSLECCLICFRPKYDVIHGAEAARITKISTVEPEPVDLAVKNEILQDLTLETFSVLQLPSEDIDPGPVPGEPIEIQEPICSTDERILCAGHECSMCKRTWHHDYDCKGKKQNGLCSDCISQAVVDISRPVEIEQIAQTASSNLTGAEAAGLRIEHESFVYNMIRDDKGEVKPDWIEIIHSHRRDLMVKIERFRVMEMATSKIFLNTSAEELMKKTPEEIEQFKRDARKAKQKKDSEPKAEKPVDTQAAYKKMLSGLMKSIATKRRDKGLGTLSNEDLEAKAKQIYDATMNEEAD